MGDSWHIVEDVSVWSGVTDEKRRGTRDGCAPGPAARVTCRSSGDVSVDTAHAPRFPPPQGSPLDAEHLRGLRPQDGILLLERHAALLPVRPAVIHLAGPQRPQPRRQGPDHPSHGPHGGGMCVIVCTFAAWSRRLSAASMRQSLSRPRRTLARAPDQIRSS